MPDSPVPSLIPRPARVEWKEGAFELRRTTRILLGDASPETARVAQYLAAKLRPAAGLPLPIAKASARSAAKRCITLSLSGAQAGLGDEGYELEATPDGAAVRASAASGLFWGAQTLRQLGPDFLMGERPAREIRPALRCCAIADSPRYSWRGFMFDSGRHFQSVPFLKRYIDLFAYLKLNRFHWHLTEDQGWRIEIKRYPELTKIGSRVDPGEQRHGFYTQDEARDIVDYAAARHILVIPEIEIPGHSLAAMLSRPRLCCTGKPVKNPGHQRDLYCAGREETFEFLENVLTEICAIFPAPFVHIGGDEAPKERWRECKRCQARIRNEGLKNEAELQGYVTRRVADFLATKGRRIIGWDEILDSGVALPRDAIIHWWRHRTGGAEAAIRAARQGHDAIASPNSYTYLSFPTSPTPTHQLERTIDLPKIWGANFTPDGLTAEERGRILGGEACLWGEHELEEEIDYKVFPRLLALAELLWSPASRGQGFADFYGRVQRHCRRLSLMGFAHGPAFRHVSEAE